MKTFAFILTSLFAFFQFNADAVPVATDATSNTLSIEQVDNYEAIWADEDCLGNIPNSAGKYVKSTTNGDSECGCWNRVAGGKSIGKHSGTWYFFDGPDCQAVVGSGNQISSTAGCNPYEVTCLLDGPKNLNIDCLHVPNSRGAYTLTPRDQRGQSSCGCWNRDAGGQSFGQLQGKWTLFLQLNCVPAVGEVNLFQTAQSTDPTELECVDEI